MCENPLWRTFLFVLVNVTVACNAIVLFRKLWNVIATPYSAHTLTLFHSLYPGSFCFVLKIEIQHTKCDGVISSCSDDLHSANDCLMCCSYLCRVKYGAKHWESVGDLYEYH
jgi:hypothetical protein